MREPGRWHLTDIQRLLVVLMVIVALFLSAMSLGMREVVLVLVALLLLIIAGLFVFLLGLRYNGQGGTQGTAHVIAAPPPPVKKIVGRCDLRLLVDLPGRPAVMMKLRDPSVSVTKWPYVGMTLPIEVSPDNPRQLRIRWEGVPDLPTRESSPAFADTPVAPVTEYPQEVRLPDLDVGFLEDSPTPPKRKVDPDHTVLTGTIVEPTVLGPVLFDQETDDLIRGDPDVDADARAADDELPARFIPQPRAETPPESASLGGAEPGMDVMLIVSNLDASLRFYEGVLKFPVVEATDATAVLSYGGGRILLQQMPDMSPVDRRLVHLHMRVKDLDTAYQHLRVQGVTFAHRPKVMRRTDRHEVWVATFHDPDGHAIGLTEWRTRDTVESSSD